MDVALFILGWLLLGLLAAGFTFAHTQHEYPDQSHRQALSFALMWGLVAGPIALLIVLAFEGFGEYGWRLKPTEEEKALYLKTEAWRRKYKFNV